MKTLQKILVASLVAMGMSSAVLAAEFTKGEVTKVDPKQKKITIKHEELTDLGMPAMTMVFVVADDAMLDEVKEGQTIEFTADRVNGRITVTDIK
jgi:Cu/Ag efflux protein CusF